jgi:hypothetical protein
MKHEERRGQRELSAHTGPTVRIKEGTIAVCKPHQSYFFFSNILLYYMLLTFVNREQMGYFLTGQNNGYLIALQLQ